MESVGAGVILDLTAGPDLMALPSRQQRRKAMRDWLKRDRRAMAGLEAKEADERSLYKREFSGSPQ
jgi:hypothetical protein